MLVRQEHYGGKHSQLKAGIKWVSPIPNRNLSSVCFIKKEFFHRFLYVRISW